LKLYQLLIELVAEGRITDSESLAILCGVQMFRDHWGDPVPEGTTPGVLQATAEVLNACDELLKGLEEIGK